MVHYSAGNLFSGVLLISYHIFCFVKIRGRLHCFVVNFTDCRLLVVMGRDFVSALLPLWLIVLPPDESEYDRVSERDRLGLTHHLTTRDPWRSRKRTRK
jgi:hypothetical protein